MGIRRYEKYEKSFKYESDSTPQNEPVYSGGGSIQNRRQPSGCGKWESGESAPDVINCNALAEMYNVSMDDLVNYNEKERDGLAIPPKDKHMFGCVSVGERGQIVIPKKAREIFDIKPGDRLMVLGDEDPERAGIAIVKEDVFMELAAQIMDAVKRGEE